MFVSCALKSLADVCLVPVPPTPTAQPQVNMASGHVSSHCHGRGAAKFAQQVVFNRQYRCQTLPIQVNGAALQPCVMHTVTEGLQRLTQVMRRQHIAFRAGC